MSNVTILRTAHIDCADNILYENANPATSTIIGCHAFLIKNNSDYYLVDTGIENIEIVNKTKSSMTDWGRNENEFNVIANLSRIGINCDMISKVFLTHSHYDHISGVANFKNAMFYMTKTEYYELYSESNKMKEYLEDVKVFLKNAKVVLIEDEAFIDNVIKCKIRGGHTKGSMSVELVDEKILFCGDTAFVQKNIKERITPGFVVDREQSKMTIAAYSQYKGRIITSHDINEVI